MMKQKPPGQRGFTLIESLITIAIASIMLAMGVPSLQNMLERNAVAGHVNNFIGTINFARSEAMKRGVPVVMCASANAETSDTPTCSGGVAYANGWIVFADRNSDNVMSAANSDVLLRVQGAFTDSGGITQSPVGKLVFRSTGLMRSGASTVTFESRSAAAAQQRRVCVTLSGRTRSITNNTDVCE